MFEDVRKSNWNKVVFVGAGLLIAYGMSDPINDKTAKAYLENNRYSQVEIGAIGGSCGKHKKIFPFKAISHEGRSSTSGEICVDGFPTFTWIKV